MLNGQRVNNPFSLSLSRAICQLYVFTRTPLPSSFLSLSLTREKGANEETEKGEEKDRGGRGWDGESGRGRGLGIASCIEEHKRSRNNTIGRRASEHRLTRARTFRARIRVLSPAGGDARIHGGWTRRKHQACAPSFLVKTRVHARIMRPGMSAYVRPIFIYTTHTQPARRALRKSPRATAKGGSKVDLFFFFLPSEVNPRYTDTRGLTMIICGRISLSR